MKNIVLFASGSGTNAENIITHFANNPTAKVVALFCNKPDAPVLQKAANHQIPTVTFTKEDFTQGLVDKKLLAFRPDLIVLAGFLLKMPQQIVQAFPNKIINIHPALLPKYGGKGMYGHYVHRTVHQNKDPETGITIHYVNENYDEGNTIFQATTKLQGTETPEQIAQKVHQLELLHFPLIIESLL